MKVTSKNAGDFISFSNRCINHVDILFSRQPFQSRSYAFSDFSSFSVYFSLFYVHGYICAWWRSWGRSSKSLSCVLTLPTLLNFFSILQAVVPNNTMLERSLRRFKQRGIFCPYLDTMLKQVLQRATSGHFSKTGLHEIKGNIHKAVIRHPLTALICLRKRFLYGLDTSYIHFERIYAPSLFLQNWLHSSTMMSVVVEIHKILWYAWCIFRPLCRIERRSFFVRLRGSFHGFRKFFHRVSSFTGVCIKPGVTCAVWNLSQVTRHVH